jgi:hypothetical protein
MRYYIQQSVPATSVHISIEERSDDRWGVVADVVSRENSDEKLVRQLLPR